MEIKPFELVEIGEGFAAYDDDGTLIIYDRDRAKVVKQLAVATGQAPEATEPLDIMDALDNMRFADLRTLAREQGIPGFHRMSAEAIRQAIKAKVESEAGETEVDADDDADSEGTDEEPSNA